MTYKSLWLRNEDPSMTEWNALCDRLHSLIPAFRDEFMRGFSSIEERLKFDGMNVNTDGNPNLQNTGDYNSYNAWQVVAMKHINKYADHRYDNPETADKFPTVAKLIDEYGDNIQVAFYSGMAPQTVLHRHTGPENLDGLNIRVHIPLIVPKGNLFLEVNGQFATWDDIFCFDNQTVHSAHNYSDEWRLVLIIDFRRASIGIPPGLPYDKERSGDPSITYDRNRQIGRREMPK